VNDDKSVVVNNENFIEQVEENLDKYYKDAYKVYKAFYKHLALYNREDIIGVFKEDKRNEFLQLREEFRTEKDEEFEQSVYENVLNTDNGSNDNTSDDDEEEEEVESEEEEVESDVEEEKPKKTAKRK